MDSIFGSVLHHTFVYNARDTRFIIGKPSKSTRNLISCQSMNSLRIFLKKNYSSVTYTKAFNAIQPVGFNRKELKTSHTFNWKNFCTIKKFIKITSFIRKTLKNQSCKNKMKKSPKKPIRKFKWMRSNPKKTLKSETCLHFCFF